MAILKSCLILLFKPKNVLLGLKGKCGKKMANPSVESVEVLSERLRNFKWSCLVKQGIRNLLREDVGWRLCKTESERLWETAGLGCNWKLKAVLVQTWRKLFPALLGPWEGSKWFSSCHRFLTFTRVQALFCGRWILSVVICYLLNSSNIGKKENVRINLNGKVGVVFLEYFVFMLEVNFLY